MRKFVTFAAIVLVSSMSGVAVACWGNSCPSGSGGFSGGTPSVEGGGFTEGGAVGQLLDGFGEVGYCEGKKTMTQQLLRGTLEGPSPGSSLDD